MSALTILMTGSTVLTLAGIALGVFAIWQTRALSSSVEARLETTGADSDSRAEQLRERMDAMTAKLHELERQPSVTLAPGVPKPGMNVVKRAQALRLHRRGDAPADIAAALELPRQEVDLLLKVHRIVMSNV
jgi:hypothetical protein